MEDEPRERQLNIHLDPENLAGVYANFANVSFSDYEFTVTFARIDHEVEEGDVPGVVVSRVNMSPRFLRELIDAMNDSWSKWSTREGIRNLPEQPSKTSELFGHRDPLAAESGVCRSQSRQPRRRVRVGEARGHEALLERDGAVRILRGLRARASRPPPRSGARRRWRAAA